MRDLLRAGPEFEQTSDRKVRVAIVGGGFGRAFHFHEHPNCEVVAVAELDEARRQELVERYRPKRAYESLEQVLEDDEVEAVGLFTPAPLHAEQAVACMEAGKHVLSAVPACITLEQARALREAKQRTGRIYMMAETSWYRPECILAKLMYRAGLFGEFVYCEAEYYHPMRPESEERKQLWFRGGKPTWRYGYPPMLYPTHSTGFLVGVTGERIVRIFCVGCETERVPKDNAYGNRFGNEMAMCITELGRPFRCNVCWDMKAAGERAQWFGTDAAVYMPSSGGQPFVVQVEGQEDVTEQPDYMHWLPPAMRYDTGHGGSHPFITHEFVMAIVEEREPEIGLDEALAMTVPGIVGHQVAMQGGGEAEVPQI